MINSHTLTTISAIFKFDMKDLRAANCATGDGDSDWNTQNILQYILCDNTVKLHKILRRRQ